MYLFNATDVRKKHNELNIPCYNHNITRIEHAGNALKGKGVLHAIRKTLNDLQLSIGIILPIVLYVSEVQGPLNHNI